MSNKPFHWLFENSLGSYLTQKTAQSIDASILKWKEAQIQTIAVVGSYQDESINKLSSYLVRHGFQVHIVDSRSLTAPDFLLQFRTSRTLFLHDGSNAKIKAGLRLDSILDAPLVQFQEATAEQQIQPKPIQNSEPTIASKSPNGNVIQIHSKPTTPKPPHETTDQKSEINQAETKTTDTQPIDAEHSEEPKATAKTDVAAKPVSTNSNSIEKIKVSFWNLRVKTVLILSVLISGALTAVIFWASTEFTQDVGRTIEDNATNLNEVITQKVNLILNQTQYNSNLIADQASSRSNNLNTDYFQGNDNILAIVLINPSNESFNIESILSNQNLQQSNGLNEQDITNIVNRYSSSLQIAKTGATMIVNASPDFQIPLIAIAFPTANRERLIITIMMANHITESFLGSDASVSFMVDRNGNIIAHPDANVALSALNVAELPLFQAMMKSTVDLGMIRYENEGKWYRGAFKKLPIGGLGVLYTIEEAKAFAAITEIRNRNLMVLGIVLSLAVIVGYFYARSLVIPIRQLVAATSKVEEEDYSVQVKPKSHDEVGVLASSFNKMVTGLAERERMKDAFGRFVNKEIAERAMRGEINLGGEEKHCAVFFSDLRGFTAMAEKMQPGEVVEYLNRYFTLMVDCVDRTHGVVDKFIGDAVMATWGSVISKGNDTENAIDGALMMRRALQTFNQYNKEHNLPIAKFGCGINTGPVVSGQIGSEKKLEFTVIGDAVNLASRIESLNKPFASDILISQNSYDLVTGIFDVVRMPAITVKGKKEPQTIYCVLGRFDDDSRPRTIEEVRSIAGIDWNPQTNTGDIFQEEKEEKYEIVEK